MKACVEKFHLGMEPVRSIDQDHLGYEFGYENLWKKYNRLNTQETKSQWTNSVQI